RLVPLLGRDKVRAAVRNARLFADGLCDAEQLRAGWSAVRKALSVAPLGTKWEEALMAALHATSQPMTGFSAVQTARAAALALDDLWQQEREPWTPADAGPRRRGSPDEAVYQCAVLRDLVPFTPVPVDPAWLEWDSGQVARLARAIAAEERFQDLPILADA